MSDTKREYRGMHAEAAAYRNVRTISAEDEN